MNQKVGQAVSLTFRFKNPEVSVSSSMQVAQISVKLSNVIGSLCDVDSINVVRWTWCVRTQSVLWPNLSTCPNNIIFDLAGK